MRAIKTAKITLSVPSDVATSALCAILEEAERQRDPEERDSDRIGVIANLARFALDQMRIERGFR